MLIYIDPFALSRQTPVHQAVMVVRNAEWDGIIFDGKTDPDILSEGKSVCQTLGKLLEDAVKTTFGMFGTFSYFIFLKMFIYVFICF